MKKLLAIVCALSLVFTCAQAVTVSFDTPGDLANNFSLNGTSGYYVQLTGSGINNTGSVAVNQSSGTAAAIPTPPTFNGTVLSATTTISVFFKCQLATSFDDALNIGLADNTNDIFTTGANTGSATSSGTGATLSVALVPNSNGGIQNTVTFGIRSQGTGGTRGAFGTNFNLTPGEFYRFNA